MFFTIQFGRRERGAGGERPLFGPLPQGRQSLGPGPQTSRGLGAGGRGGGEFRDRYGRRKQGQSSCKMAKSGYEDEVEKEHACWYVLQVACKPAIYQSLLNSFLISMLASLSP